MRELPVVCLTCHGLRSIVSFASGDSDAARMGRQSSVTADELDRRCSACEQQGAVGGGIMGCWR